MTPVEFCPECQGLCEDETTGLPCWRCKGLGEIDVDYGDESEDTDE